ncbi:hypothetical protein [Aeromicrobium sp. UC242_57]|uniref:hypothetical protein n=1 Tax=Aeromicrobium sp. UC242_57 TaxID=3374624 RepID=UPI0037BA86FC
MTSAPRRPPHRRRCAALRQAQALRADRAGRSCRTPRRLVLVSGAVEIAAGAMLLDPRSRRFGGVLAAGLLAAVFPANVQMAADGLRSRRAPAWYKIGLIARLPLQAPMIRIALKAVRS